MQLRRSVAVFLIVILCVSLCGLGAAAYDFSKTFVGDRIDHTVTTDPGAIVKWAVFDPSGDKITHTIDRADSEGLAVAEDPWVPTAPGTYEIVRYINNVEDDREEVEVFPCYALDEPYIDDFSEVQGWYDSDDVTPEGYIEKRLSRSGMVVSKTCPIIPTQFTYELDVIFVEDKEGGAGVVFGRLVGPEVAYHLFINRKGYFAIYKFTEKASLVRDWEQSPHIKTGLRTLNRLKMEVKGGVTTFYANGNQIAQLTKRFEPGRFGFTVVNFDGITTVRFDKLSIQKL